MHDNLRHWLGVELGAVPVGLGVLPHTRRVRHGQRDVVLLVHAGEQERLGACMDGKSILIKHESCVSVCLFVRVFQSHQKSQFHELLDQGVIWVNLKDDEAQFF